MRDNDMEEHPLDTKINQAVIDFITHVESATTPATYARADEHKAKFGVLTEGLGQKLVELGVGKNAALGTEEKQHLFAFITAVWLDGYNTAQHLTDTPKEH